MVAVGHPEAPAAADRHRALGQIVAIVDALPCYECRNHARAYMYAHPPNLASGPCLQGWTWRFHNAVNARLGKPQLSARGDADIYREDVDRCRYRKMM